jgi:hypothetical protein
MRWAALLGVCLISLTVTPATVRGKEPGKTPKPKQQCILFCRQVDEDDKSFYSGDHSLGSGESVAALPNVDVSVTHMKKDGAELDVAFDVSSDKATAEPKGRTPADWLRDGQMKDGRRHVVRFVKFNETLAIPLGEKQPNGVTPRFEIMIGGGDVIRWDWAWGSKELPLSPDEAEREAVLNAVSDSGFARISFVCGSRLADRMGELAYDFFYEGIEFAQRYVMPAADLYCTYCPHRLGWLDLASTAGPLPVEWLAMHQYENRIEYERAVFGSVGCYQVDLIDGPALMQNLTALARLSERTRVAVTIYKKDFDYQVVQAMEKLRIRDVTFCCDAEPPPLWHACEWHNDVEGKSRSDAVKMASVNCQSAKAAIPALKKLARLEEILIYTNAKRTDERKARETLRALQKALPKAEVHLVILAEK